MKAEDLLQERMLDVARDEGEDGFVRAQADEVGRDADHVAEVGEGLVGEVDEGAVEDGLGFLRELEVAGDVVGG